MSTVRRPPDGAVGESFGDQASVANSINSGPHRPDSGTTDGAARSRPATPPAPRLPPVVHHRHRIVRVLDGPPTQPGHNVEGLGEPHESLAGREQRRGGGPRRCARSGRARRRTPSPPSIITARNPASTTRLRRIVCVAVTSSRAERTGEATPTTSARVSEGGQPERRFRRESRISAGRDHGPTPARVRRSCRCHGGVPCRCKPPLLVIAHEHVQRHFRELVLGQCPAADVRHRDPRRGCEDCDHLEPRGRAVLDAMSW